MRIYYILILGFILLLTGCSNAESNPSDKSSTNEGIAIIHQNYEDKGLECKKIKETLERGDCFQSINESYLQWGTNILRDFQYIYVPDEEWEGWQNLLIFTIDASDALVNRQQLDHYEEYLIKNEIDTTENIEEIFQKQWYIFSNLFPQSAREDLKGIVMSDLDGPMFVVGRNEFNVEETLLVLSDETLAYDAYQRWFLIHEFAHILTLSEEQVHVEEELYHANDEALLEKAATSCSSYFWFGCVNETSYLHEYYLDFWEALEEDYDYLDWTSDEAFNDFYLRYEDYFFNAYQALNPGEDIAESFTFFIMLHSDDAVENAEMKYEKVKFFYQYEELVDLRTQILENLYDLSVRDKTFY